jgi:hypothetical protein
MPNVGDHADDLPLVAAHDHDLAERIRAGEELRCSGLVEDRDLASSRPIVPRN